MIFAKVDNFPPDVWANANVNPSGTESGIFWENQVNTLVADALVPCVAGTSAGIISMA